MPSRRNQCFVAKSGEVQDSLRAAEAALAEGLKAKAARFFTAAFDAMPSLAKVGMRAAVLWNDLGEALIVKRPLHGLWGGLWEFPRASLLPGELPSEGAGRALKEFADQNVIACGSVGALAHSVTHHRITLHGVLLKLQFDSSPIFLSFHSAYAWVQPVELSRYALSAPQIVLKNQLIESLSQSNLGQITLSFEV